MFYRPGLDPHGLAHNPFKALVSPRPIGWIASLDGAGRVNLAPYSFFNAVADTPPMVVYSSTGRKADGAGKDSLGNIRETGEFVANIVPFALREAMNLTSGSYPPDIDEFALAGLTPAPSVLVRPPRVAEAPAALECRLWRVIDLPGEANHLVIGEVVGIHIADSVVAGGIVDVASYRPVARLGYHDYAVVTELFQMTRPEGG